MEMVDPVSTSYFVQGVLQPASFDKPDGEITLELAVVNS